MDKGNFIHNIFYLVPLQVADHMPADVVWQHGVFVHDLLDLVFPKVPAPCLVCFF